MLITACVADKCCVNVSLFSHSNLHYTRAGARLTRAKRNPGHNTNLPLGALGPAQLEHNSTAPALACLHSIWCTQRAPAPRLPIFAHPPLQIMSLNMPEARIYLRTDTWTNIRGQTHRTVMLMIESGLGEYADTVSHLTYAYFYINTLRFRSFYLLSCPPRASSRARSGSGG